MAATVSNLGRGNYVLGGLGAVRGPSAADAMVENQQEARAAREAELLAQQRRQQMQLAQSEEARAQSQEARAQATFAQQQEAYRRQQAAAAEARNRAALVRQAQEEFLRRRPAGLTIPTTATTAAAPPPASARVSPLAFDALPQIPDTPEDEAYRLQRGGPPGVRPVARPERPVAPAAAPGTGVPGVRPLSMGLQPIGPAGTPSVDVAALDPMESFRLAARARPDLFGGVQVADLSGGAGEDTLPAAPDETTRVDYNGRTYDVFPGGRVVFAEGTESIPAGYELPPGSPTYYQILERAGQTIQVELDGVPYEIIPTDRGSAYVRNLLTGESFNPYLSLSSSDEEVAAQDALYNRLLEQIGVGSPAAPVTTAGPGVAGMFGAPEQPLAPATPAAPAAPAAPATPATPAAPAAPVTPAMPAVQPAGLTISPPAAPDASGAVPSTFLTSEGRAISLDAVPLGVRPAVEQGLAAGPDPVFVGGPGAGYFVYSDRRVFDIQKALSGGDPFDVPADDQDWLRARVGVTAPESEVAGMFEAPGQPLAPATPAAPATPVPIPAGATRVDYNGGTYDVLPDGGVFNASTGDELPLNSPEYVEILARSLPQFAPAAPATPATPDAPPATPATPAAPAAPAAAEAPGIRAVNPQASALVQDVQELARQGDIARALSRIQVGLTTGIYGPTSNLIGRAVGYAFDSPEEAALRTAAREAAQWFNDRANRRHFFENPDLLVEAAADPISFMSRVGELPAPETSAPSAPPAPEVAGMFEAPEQPPAPEATSGLTLTPPAAQEINTVAAQTGGDISRFYLRNPASVLQTADNAYRDIQRWEGLVQYYQQIGDMTSMVEAEIGLGQARQAFSDMSGQLALAGLQLDNYGPLQLYLQQLYPGGTVEVRPYTDGSVEVFVDGNSIRRDYKNDLLEVLANSFNEEYRAGQAAQAALAAELRNQIFEQELKTTGAIALERVQQQGRVDLKLLEAELSRLEGAGDVSLKEVTDPTGQGRPIFEYRVGGMRPRYITFREIPSDSGEPLLQYDFVPLPGSE